MRMLIRQVLSYDCQMIIIQFDLEFRNYMNYSYDIIPFEQRINSGSSFSEIKSPQLRKKKDNTKKKPKRSRRNSRRRRQVRNYWSEVQQKAYIGFLVQNLNIMQLGLKQRRKYCINMMMGKVVKTRNQRQCHSHHQKMIKKYGSLQGIIYSLDHQFSKGQDFKQPLCLERSKNQLSQDVEEDHKESTFVKQFTERVSPIIDLEESLAQFLDLGYYNHQVVNLKPKTVIS